MYVCIYIEIDRQTDRYRYIYIFIYIYLSQFLSNILNMNSLERKSQVVYNVVLYVGDFSKKCRNKKLQNMFQ